MKEVNKMYSRTYSLSFILDKDGWLKEDLIISNSLYKLDNYIKNNFNGTKDVRRIYDEKISEFCLNNMKLIQDENERNHHNATGRIVILENTYNDGRLCDVKQIKVIYHDNLLPSRKKCITKIRKSLNDDNKLKELYQRKNYLLSQNELELIRLYDRFHNRKYKKSVIGFLTNRIKEAGGTEAYYYCRHLTNLCDLLKEKKKKKVKITKINGSKIEKNMSLQKDLPYHYLESEVEQITMDKILRKDGK